MPKRITCPMNPGDLLGDCQHLGNPELGAYIRLMFFYWVHGGLPDDEKIIRRIARVEGGFVWKRTRPMLAAMFQQPGWHHKRIDRDLAKAGEFSEKMRDLASRRWQRRRGVRTPARPLVDNVEIPPQGNGGSVARKPLKTHDAKMRSAMLSLSKKDKSFFLSSHSKPGVEKWTADEARRAGSTRSPRYQKAFAKWQRDLLQRIGQDDSAQAADVQAERPEISDRATLAELREAGSGCLVALRGVHDATVPL